MWPIKKLDLETFTDDDFETIQKWPPPSDLFRKVAILCYKFHMGGDPNDGICISYQRALNNS